MTLTQFIFGYRWSVTAAACDDYVETIKRSAKGRVYVKRLGSGQALFRGFDDRDDLMVRTLLNVYDPAFAIQAFNYNAIRR